MKKNILKKIEKEQERIYNGFKGTQIESDAKSDNVTIEEYLDNIEAQNDYDSAIYYTGFISGLYTILSWIKE